MTPTTWALLGALGITGGGGAFIGLSSPNTPVVSDTPLTVGVAEVMHARIVTQLMDESGKVRGEIASLRRKMVRSNITAIERDIDSWLTVPEADLTLAQRVNLTELQDQLKRDRDELQELER